MTEDFDDHPDGESPDLELPKTRLLVFNGELQRLNQRDTVVLRLPLDSLRSIEYRRSFEPGMCIFLLVGVGLAAIGYFVSQNNIVTAALYAAAIILAGFSLLGTFGVKIIIVTDEGSNTIVCNDLNDEAEGFVRSVQHLLHDRKR